MWIHKLYAGLWSFHLHHLTPIQLSIDLSSYFLRGNITGRFYDKCSKSRPTISKSTTTINHRELPTKDSVATNFDPGQRYSLYPCLTVLIKSLYTGLRSAASPALIDINNFWVNILFKSHFWCYFAQNQRTIFGGSRTFLPTYQSVCASMIKSFHQGDHSYHHGNTQLQHDTSC